jgi:hypothetical protein
MRKAVSAALQALSCSQQAAYQPVYLAIFPPHNFAFNAEVIASLAQVALPAKVVLTILHCYLVIASILARVVFSK